MPSHLQASILSHLPRIEGMRLISLATWIISSKLSKKSLMKLLFLLSSSYRWGNWSIEIFRNSKACMLYYCTILPETEKAQPTCIHGVYSYHSQTVGSTAYILLHKDCDFSWFFLFNHKSNDKQEKSCLLEMICSCII